MSKVDQIWFGAVVSTNIRILKKIALQKLNFLLGQSLLQPFWEAQCFFYMQVVFLFIKNVSVYFVHQKYVMVLIFVNLPTMNQI